MNIDEQRTKFESWATGQRMSIARSIVDHPQWKYEYVSNTTESAWRAWLESVQQNTQELTQRIGELCQQVNERDATIAALKLDLFSANGDLAVYRDHYRRHHNRCTICNGSLLYEGGCTCKPTAERQPIIDRCKTCGLALNDDGTCDDCFRAGMQLGLIDAKEKPNDKSCHTD